jgi:hypothetical protein
VNFLDRFSKNTQLSSCKSVQWELRCSMRTGGWIDMMKLIAAFCNFVNTSKNESDRVWKEDVMS